MKLDELCCYVAHYYPLWESYSAVAAVVEQEYYQWLRSGSLFSDRDP